MTVSNGNDDDENKNKWDFPKDNAWGDPPPELAEPFQFDEQFKSEDSKEYDVYGEVLPDKKNDEVDAKQAVSLPSKQIVKLQPHVLCGIIAVANVVQGGFVGTIFGLGHATLEGIQLGLHRQPGFSKHVMKSSALSGLSFGGWLGCYSGIKCGLKETRGKADWVNACGAGFLSGAVSALRTRSPQQIFVAGVGSAFLMTFVESLSGFR